MPQVPGLGDAQLYPDPRSTGRDDHSSAGESPDFDAAAAQRALALAVRHINASAREPVDDATLLAALRSQRVPDALNHYLRAFFDETEVETLSDLARSGAVSYEQLARGARRHLPPGHETRRWLDERA